MPKIILDEVLKRKKISKRQFSRMLGLSAYHNVFRLFHADHNPRFSTLVKWARLLKVKVRDLIKE